MGGWLVRLEAACGPRDADPSVWCGGGYWLAPGVAMPVVAPLKTLLHVVVVRVTTGSWCTQLHPVSVVVCLCFVPNQWLGAGRGGSYVES